MRRMLIGLIATLLFSSFAVQAEIDVIANRAVKVGRFDLSIGSEVTLKSNDPSIAGRAIFLGLNISPNGEMTNQMYLHLKSSKIVFIDSRDIANKQTMQTVLDPFPQAGGTCTGYAMDSFIIQTHLSGFRGIGELEKTMASEDSRTTMLVDLIHEYYLNAHRRNSIRGILDGYGKKFGFKCNTFDGSDLAKAKTKILTQLTSGLPVLFSFTLGPNMVRSPFPLSFYQNTKEDTDDRLWIPRKIGERNAGGHSIVAAGAFSYNQKTYLVMIDSDWSQPRLWDFDAFVNERVALDEIEFTLCK